MKHNPKFDGKISILAHSLGAVISYDLLVAQVGRKISEVGNFPKQIMISREET
jgi:hypothetical protein